MPHTGYDQYDTLDPRRQAAENIVRGGHKLQVVVVKLMLGNQSIDNGDVSADNPLPVGIELLDQQVGTWSYNSGNLTSAGTISLTGRCLGLSVFANGVTGSFKINGGPTITLRPGVGLSVNPQANIVNPVVTWVSGNLDVYIEAVT